MEEGTRKGRRRSPWAFGKEVALDAECDASEAPRAEGVRSKAAAGQVFPEAAGSGLGLSGFGLHSRSAVMCVFV